MGKKRGDILKLHSRYQFKPYKCPICHGRGTVSTTFYVSQIASGCVNSMNEITCKSCGGKGIVWG